MKDKADTYCGKCIKADVCGMEDVYDPATTYCAYRVEARPHGEWIHTKECDEEFQYRCSNCNLPIRSNSHHFCPHCGADMREGEGNGI